MICVPAQPGLLADREGRYSRRAMRLSLCLLLLLGVVTAGCDTEPSVYKAESTANCLRKHGYQVTTDPNNLGVVEGHTENGGLVARHPGNAIRIAFGASSDDAPGIENGYRLFAPKKLRPHITDVMRTQKNAVLLWTVTPPQDEMDTVFGCLKG
jgi:hypothetical protein